ncbi:septum formation family protein [Dactylosporangium cerinum]|uniref:Septum formation family protein n=1 Tax=Dactylosporangium cerinum TaxID=1434730 RepID=A0ABV9WCM3_9ACTN
MVRFRLGAVLALTLVVVAGCTKVPAGVDKDIVDEWAMMGEAKVPEPKAGDCWTSTSTSVFRMTAASTTVAMCSGPHIGEVVQVGHFTGALAEADSPPKLDQMADIYTACDAEVTKFLGASWQLGRARMLLFPPTSTQWRGGARFYRCDVASLKGAHGDLESRVATLKDSMKPGSDRLDGCAVLDNGVDWTGDVTPVVCTAPHDVESMGLITAKSGTYPATSEAAKTVFDTLCVDKIREYTSGGINALATAKARYLYPRHAGSAEEWSAGNHNATCWVLLPKKITRSLKGNGSKAV